VKIKMNTPAKSFQSFLSFRAGKTLLAIVILAIGVYAGGYQILKPSTASAAVVAGITPAAAPLDDNSVNAITALDQAMEKLAAHVTPAVVNVTVTSRTRGRQLPNGHPQIPGMPNQDPDENQGGNDQDGNNDSNSIQRFFFGPFGQQRQGPQIEHGLGSGIIISPDGYIVTNHHVIDGAVDIRVTMNDRRVLPAKLIGYDKLTDLAVIKIDAPNLPSLSWGDSTILKPGQTVLP
jgi:serine protease Do